MILTANQTSKTNQNVLLLQLISFLFNLLKQINWHNSQTSTTMRHICDLTHSCMPQYHCAIDITSDTVRVRVNASISAVTIV